MSTFQRRKFPETYIYKKNEVNRSAIRPYFFVSDPRFNLGVGATRFPTSNMAVGERATCEMTSRPQEMIERANASPRIWRIYRSENAEGVYEIHENRPLDYRLRTLALHNVVYRSSTSHVNSPAILVGFGTLKRTLYGNLVTFASSCEKARRNYSTGHIRESKTTSLDDQSFC